MAKRPQRRRGSAPAFVIREIAKRAAELGVTRERIIEECAKIAFSSIFDVISVGADGKMAVKSEALPPEVAAAICEIVASASSQQVYRVKMHDKRGALLTLARILNMLPPIEAGVDEEQDKDPLAVLLETLDRFAAEKEAGGGAGSPPA